MRSSGRETLQIWYSLSLRGTERAGCLFVEDTGMREQGSLKGQGTHRGNLCVHIFKQILTLKDIQRKKSKQEIYSFFCFLKILLGVQKRIQMPNIDVK